MMITESNRRRILSEREGLFCEYYLTPNQDRVLTDTLVFSFFFMAVCMSGTYFYGTIPIPIASTYPEEDFCWSILILWSISKTADYITTSRISNVIIINITSSFQWTAWLCQSSKRKGKFNGGKSPLHTNFDVRPKRL